MTFEEYQNHTNIKMWNIALSGTFIVLVFLAFSFLFTFNLFPRIITIADLVIITLATFRLIRLTTYDAITVFLREAFLKKVVTKSKAGKITVTYEEEERGIKRAISILLNCPWCVGIWISLLVLFLYYAFPAFWFFFTVIAIAGVASLLQIAANGLGWTAEKRKIETGLLNK